MRGSSGGGNTFDDFPAETFTIFLHCDVWDRSGRLKRSKIPDSMTVQQLVKVVQCSRRNPRNTSIRIVYTGAEGYGRLGAGVGRRL